MAALSESDLFDTGNSSEDLFERICKDIQQRGYSINPDAVPAELSLSLYRHVHTMKPCQFDRAGIGREQQQTINPFVRTDEICWINGESQAGRQWLKWMARLQQHLNRRLFLGLFSFESHFAHYAPGDFYKRHLDAFKGEANRILSVVVYLNPDWYPDDGGELVLYQDQQDMQGIKVTPALGTIVAFLSEELPHEVVKAKRNRYSIAGWFRLNSSSHHRVDPPR